MIYGSLFNVAISQLLTIVISQLKLKLMQPILFLKIGLYLKSALEVVKNGVDFSNQLFAFMHMIRGMTLN